MKKVICIAISLLLVIGMCGVVCADNPTSEEKTLTKDVAPSYTLTFSAEPAFGSSSMITLAGLIASDLSVTVVSAHPKAETNDFQMQIAGKDASLIAYTVEKGTGDPKTEIKSGETIITLSAGSGASASESATLTFTAPSEGYMYAGTYTDTLTFNVA